MSGPFKMKGFPLIEGTSPAKHKPWTKAHKERVAHSGTAEAHGAKPKPLPGKPKPPLPMKDSPAKCPLIAALAPMVAGMAAKKKE